MIPCDFHMFQWWNWRIFVVHCMMIVWWLMMHAMRANMAKDAKDAKNAYVILCYIVWWHVWTSSNNIQSLSHHKPPHVPGSRCFTISLVLRGRKAVSAQAMRSSNAAPSHPRNSQQIWWTFQKFEITWDTQQVPSMTRNDSWKMELEFFKVLRTD